jgi:hypothetical protein
MDIAHGPLDGRTSGPLRLGIYRRVVHCRSGDPILDIDAQRL